MKCRYHIRVSYHFKIFLVANSISLFSLYSKYHINTVKNDFRILSVTMQCSVYIIQCKNVHYVNKCVFRTLLEPYGPQTSSCWKSPERGLNSGVIRPSQLLGPDSGISCTLKWAPSLTLDFLNLGLKLIYLDWFLIHVYTYILFYIVLNFI